MPVANDFVAVDGTKLGTNGKRVKRFGGEPSACGGEPLARPGEPDICYRTVKSPLAGA
ncbi:hypothetical protein [uncultured Fibrella sp.]|uniref:hypothetical protein n=1 Tax=uncultured Fibrella sp. TaxID=1284596 RepID=UPI0035CC2D3D